MIPAKNDQHDAALSTSGVELAHASDKPAASRKLAALRRMSTGAKLQGHARVASKAAADKAMVASKVMVHKADEGFAACCYVFMRAVLKCFLVEQGAFATAAVPVIVKEYLDRKHRFACTPDHRFEDYDLGFGASQPVWNQSTHGKMACLCCYPLFCLPCCCQRRRGAPSAKCCNALATCCNCHGCMDTVLKNERSPSPAKRACATCTFGCCCTFPVVWDFFFESNRSRMLSTFNSILCLLLLVVTLNPLAPAYESSISCRDAFGFRPKIVHSGSCLLEGLSFPVNRFNCSGVDVSKLSRNPDAFCGGAMDFTMMGFLSSANIKAAYTRAALPNGGNFFANGAPTCVAPSGHLYVFADNTEPSVMTAGSKGVRTIFSIVYRPFLLSMANSRSNRGFGWAGVGWAGAIVNNIFTMTFRSKDIRYCGEGPGVVGDLSGLQLGGDFGTQTPENYAHKDGYKLNGEPVTPVTQDDVDLAVKQLHRFDTASNWHLYWKRPLPFMPQDGGVWDVKTTITYACLCHNPHLVDDDADEALLNQEFRCDRNLFPWLTANVASCGDGFRNCSFPKVYDSPEKVFPNDKPSDGEELRVGIAKLRGGPRHTYVCPYGKDDAERALAANNFIHAVFPEVNISVPSVGLLRSFSNVSGWLGNNVPLTFVPNLEILETTGQTLNVLKQISFPFPISFGGHDGTRVRIPDEPDPVYDKPQSISNSVRRAFRPRLAYASYSGGFFWGLNWVNYIGLSLELVLLLWLAVKFTLRRYHDSLLDICSQCSSKSAGGRKRKRNRRAPCRCLRSFFTARMESSFRRRSAHGEVDVEVAAFDAERDFVPSNAHIKFRVPTRLVASLVLASVMVVGASWRMAKTWIRLEKAAVGMQSQYQHFVKQSGSAWEAMLDASTQTMMTAAKALATGSSVDDMNRWVESEFLRGFAHANNQTSASEIGKAFFSAMTASQIGVLESEYNITEAGMIVAIAPNMYANARRCTAESQTAAMGALQRVVSTTLQQSATAVPAIAAAVMGGVTDIRAPGAENENMNWTLPDLSTTDLIAMSPENRAALFASILQEVTALAVEGARPVRDESAASCVDAVRSTTEGLAVCIVEKTLTDISLTQQVLQSSPQIPSELTSAMVAGFKVYLDFGSYHEEDFPTRLCEDVGQRVFAMVENYVIPKLADPGQILAGAVETLISSGEVMQLINEIPGIDPQTFVNSLVHKKDDESDVWDDSDEGNGSPKTNESVPISSKGIELGLFIGTIKNMYSWWEKIQGVTVANTSGLEFVDWVISRALTALITVAQGGITCTVLATLALFLQMLLFYSHTHTKGLDLHRSVRKYFDPASGSYATAIMDRVGSQRMRLPNVFDIISRDPQPSEVRTLMHLSQWTDENYDTPASAGEVARSCDSKDEVYRMSKLRARVDYNDYNSKSDNAAEVGSHLKSTSSNLKTSLLADKLREDARKARSIDAQALRAHMVMSLQYRNLLSAPSFLGTYVFTIVFAFMIYFSLFFILLVLPIQELFWITVWNFRNMWLSLAVLLIIKAVIDLIIVRRLGMDKGQYSGITHPRMVSLFDGFKTIISCMIGWAPAIVRIISSVVATFILLPRLDFKLPGGVLDGSRLKYLGIIETWRLQMEYNAICTYDEEIRYRGKSMDGTSGPATTVLVDDGSARDARAVAFASTKATELAPEVTSLNPARKSVLERANV